MTMHRPVTCPSPLQEARARVARLAAALRELERSGAEHLDNCPKGKRLVGTRGDGLIAAWGAGRKAGCPPCLAEFALQAAERHEQDVVHDPVRLWAGEKGAGRALRQ